MPDFGRWTSNGGDPSLNDINRVDRFLDALGSKETAYSTDHAEAELAFLLSDWRDDVREAPVTVPVTTRDAAAALRDGLANRKRSRASLALVGSAAAAVLCVGGFGAAVFGAEPGDAFYGMRTTLFGQEQVRDEQVTLASQQLQQVQQLIDQGQWEQAQDKLVALSTTVQGVEAPPEQKQDLIEQWNALTYKVVEQDPAATLPPSGEPLPVLPDSPLTLLPVPVFDVGTSTSTTTSPTTTSQTPGPEILFSSPTTGTTTTSAPSSEPPSSEPPSSEPPSSTSTTTTSSPSSTPPSTTTSTPTKVADVTTTAAPPAPPKIALPPSTAAQAPPPASAPPVRPPQSVPPSAPVAPPAPPAPPPPAPPAPSVAPSQSEPTTVTTTAPKRASGEEEQVVTTTVAPPR